MYMCVCMYVRVYACVCVHTYSNNSTRGQITCKPPLFKLQIVSINNYKMYDQVLMPTIKHKHTRRHILTQTQTHINMHTRRTKTQKV